MRPGRIVWIGVRPARRAPLRAPRAVTANEDAGLEGDHYQGRTRGRRQVTLIQAEHLEAISAYLGLEVLDPALLRRNLVTRSINLLALKDRRFRIGGALMEWSGWCHPCSRMEETLGVGGYNAVRGHGGITARVIRGGLIRLDDAVVPEPLQWCGRE